MEKVAGGWDILLPALEEQTTEMAHTTSFQDQQGKVWTHLCAREAENIILFWVVRCPAKSGLFHTQNKRKWKLISVQLTGASFEWRAWQAKS